MERDTLFRKEALDHQQNKWSGKALLVSGIPAWLIATCCTILVMALIFFMVFADYTRRSNIYGEITTLPRSINIFSPNQGFIVKRMIKVGQIVHKGDPLYQIDVSKQTTSGIVSHNSEEAIKRQISQINHIIDNLGKNKEVTLKDLEQQLHEYQKASEQTKKLVTASREGMNFMRKNMESYKKYQKRGLINKDRFNSQLYTYYQQQSTVQNLYSQDINQSLKLIELSAKMTSESISADNQIFEYQYKLGDLKRQLSEVESTDSVIIPSPVDGKIESLSVTLGQMVNSKDSLAQIIPNKNAKYYLVMWIPNDSIPYIKKGAAVNIRYEAFPFEKFGQFPGIIYNVSYVPASIQEMSTYSNSPANNKNAVSQAYYKVLIKLDRTKFKYKDKYLELNSGMKAETTLFLERRPIYKWIFSPFYEIQKSLKGPISSE